MTKSQFLYNITFTAIFTVFVTLLLQFVCVYRYYTPITISSSLEKITDGNTEYIINFNMPDGKINPVIIDNVWWLSRFDRTTVYSELVELQHNNIKQEYCLELRGIRIPSISYQSFVTIKKIEDCIK